MVMNFKFVLIGLVLILFSVNAFAVTDLLNVHGKATNAGVAIVAGNVRAYIYDDATAGNLVYDSGAEFNGVTRSDGTFDVQLGSGVDLNLINGKIYYLDLSINGTDLDFGANERQTFQANNGRTTQLYNYESTYGDGKVTMLKLNNNLYFRSDWNSTHDLLRKFKLTSGSNNNEVDFDGTGLILKTTSNKDLSTVVFVETWTSDGDDTTPLNINGTYIGAGHGGYFVHDSTVAAHDKAAVDVGSVWQDSFGTQWTLVKIYSGTHLYFMSTITDADADTWDFNVTSGTVSGILTHVSGATNAGNITVSSSVLTQSWPAIQNKSTTVWIDGVKQVNGNGLYYADYFDVRDTYEIVDQNDMFWKIRASVGSNPAKDFNDSSINSAGTSSYVYRFQNNGAVVTFSEYRPKIYWKVNYIGLIQAGVISGTGVGTIYEYIPKINDYVDVIDYNFSNDFDITSIVPNTSFSSARWTFANNPPERFFQHIKIGGVNRWGHMIGFNQDVGLGNPSWRASKISGAGFIYTSRKQYPYLTTTSLDNNVAVNGVTFRVPMNYSKYPAATNVTWYWVGDKAYVMIDYHSNFDGTVSLPNKMVGMKIEPMEVLYGMRVDSNVVSVEGVKINVTGNKGSALLRLSPSAITNTTTSTTASQWTTSGSDIYYNTGQVVVGKTSGSYTVDINGSTRITGGSLYLDTNKYIYDSTGRHQIKFPSNWESVAIGYYACGTTTTQMTTARARNTCVGSAAGQMTTSGSFNVNIGYGAGLFNTTGSSNVVIGASSGYQNNLISSVIIGTGASGVIGGNQAYNTFIGNSSGQRLIDSNFNTCLGFQCLYDSVSDRNGYNYRTAIGYSADTNGVYSSCLGTQCFANGSYATAIGSYAQATSDNTIALGRTSDSVVVGGSSAVTKFDVNGSAMRLITPSTPATSGAACSVGQIQWDVNYVYVCVATNTWKRSLIDTW